MRVRARECVREIVVALAMVTGAAVAVVMAEAMVTGMPVVAVVAALNIRTAAVAIVAGVSCVNR